MATDATELEEGQQLDAGDGSQVEDQTTEEQNSDFEAGFSGTPQTKTPEDKPVDEALTAAQTATTQSTSQDQGKTEAGDQPKADAPKLAQITEDQFKSLLAKAESVDQLRAESKRQIDTLAGHLGGMKQIVEGLKQQRSKLTAGQLKRVAAEYPDLAKLLEEDLGESASVATETQQVDQSEIDRRVQEGTAKEVAKSVVALETKILRLHHKDWADVVVSQGFLDWQKTLPPEDQTKLLTSTDGEYIADRITEFKEKVKADQEAARLRAEAEAKARADTARGSAKPSGRQKLLEAAVQPRGSGGHPTGDAKSEDDEFLAGFNSQSQQR